MSNGLKRFTLALLVILVIFFAPRVGNYFADLLLPYFSFIDPEGIFFWGIIHHIVQALIPLVIIFFWKGQSWSAWGFQVGDWSKGIKWIGWFTLLWGSLYVIITLVNLYAENVPTVYYDVENSRNMAGELIFRGFIVGPSEEILFRAFPITLLLMAGFTRTTDIFGFEISRAGVISAVLFAIAHIGFNIAPFEVYHFSPLQIVTSLGFGLLYAIIFRHTKSIYFPMVVHSISDVIPLISLFLIHWIK